MATVYQQYSGLLEWTEHCLDVALRVDPGLSRVPLYVVNMEMNNLRGASGPGFDATFRAEIEAAKKWYGPGVCMVEDLAAKYTTHFNAARQLGMDNDRSKVFGLLAVAGLTFHELSHATRSGDYGGGSPIGGDPRIARIGFERWANDPPPADKNANPETSVPWVKHDAPFIRTICLMAGRAAKHIRGLSPAHLMDTSLYGLSPIEEYAETLQPELSASGSICRIVFLTPPPKQFVNLWRGDIGRWVQGIRGELTPEQERAALAALRLYR